MSISRSKDIDSLARGRFNRSPRQFALSTSPRTLSSRQDFLICLSLLLIGSSVARAQDKKMELAELISRHQEAVGTTAARGAIKGRFAAGTVKYVSRMGSSPNVEGTIGLVSLNPKLRYSIKFPSQQYPGEQLAFDGKHLDVGVLPGGRRTALGLVALQQDLPLKEGLLGGVLNTGWPLLKDPLAARLDYKGTKKIDGRLVHVVGYRSQKGSSDLKVILYFDADTFRHVRSEYEFLIGARMGVGPNDSTKIPESRYSVSEDFDDFKTVDGLTLPHKCKLQLSVQASMTSILTDWTLTFTQIVHNQAIEDNVFTLR